MMRIYFAVNKNNISGHFNEADALDAVNADGLLDYCDFNDNHTCAIERYNKIKLDRPLLIFGKMAA